MAKEKSYRVRTVATKEDRKRPSVFMRLDLDEAFKGHALFEPDPGLEDNPGYLEFYNHWDQQGNTYVPCAGPDCPFCMASMNPATRAMTAFYFPGNVKGEQIKIFTMNFKTISQADDEAVEEDGLLGKVVRIRKLDDTGGYRLRVVNEKPMTKAELKVAKKELEELFPNGLEGHLQNQLKIQMERLKAIDALEDADFDDDEDEDEEETPKPARKGKAIAEVAEEDEEEDEDEEDEEAEEEDEEEEDEEEEDEEEEADEDEEEDEDEEDEEEDEEPSTVEGKFSVLKVNESDETFDLENEDGKVKMWLGEGIDVDYDIVKKGVEVQLSAQKDEEGDFIITEIEPATVKKTRSRSK